MLQVFHRTRVIVQLIHAFGMLGQRGFVVVRI